MKPGPKKKPTVLRILEGNPSKRPINFYEPSCKFAPEMPSIVAENKTAAAEWVRLTEAMPSGLYTAADVSVMAIYSLAWAMLGEAHNAIQADGVTLLTSKGRITHPAARIWKQAADTLAKCADRLGLHPGARASLQIPQRGDGPSKFAGLLGRTPN